MKEIIGDILKSEEGKKAAIRISYVGAVGVGAISLAFAYRLATSEEAEIRFGKFKAKFGKKLGRKDRKALDEEIEDSHRPLV